jgi:hypothetical protein
VDIQFKSFINSSKTPRLHPILMLMAPEVASAMTKKRDPNWGLFTTDYISGFCQQVVLDHPGWHKDLSALDISRYLDSSFNKKKPWWIPGQEGLQEAADGTSHPFNAL